MADFIALNAGNLKGVAEAFAKSPGIMTEELWKGVFEAELFLERETKDTAPTASGIYRESIHATQPEIEGGVVLGTVGTGLSYALPVELGSKPHMPPIQPILDWVEQKLGLKGAEAEGAARAIAWKIKAHGTKGAHTFETAFNAKSEDANQILQRALARGIERIGGEA